MTPLEVIGAASAAVGLVMSVSGLAALILRGERRTRRVINRLVGDGTAPAALDRLDRVEASVAMVITSVAAIEAQLSPNHGSSLHDTVVRIDERTKETRDLLSAHMASPHPRR